VPAVAVLTRRDSCARLAFRQPGAATT